MTVQIQLNILYSVHFVRDDVDSVKETILREYVDSVKETLCP